MSIPNEQSKINVIKLYQNGKFFHTTNHCYLHMGDMLEMVKNSEEIVVIDNKSKQDITNSILAQIALRVLHSSSPKTPDLTFINIIQSGSICSNPLKKVQNEIT